jgi:hypothetical protein
VTIVKRNSTKNIQFNSQGSESEKDRDYNITSNSPRYHLKTIDSNSHKQQDLVMLKFKKFIDKFKVKFEI